MICACSISTARGKYGFVGYPFGTSKKKAAAIFYGTAKCFHVENTLPTAGNRRSPEGISPIYLRWQCRIERPLNFKIIT